MIAWCPCTDSNRDRAPFEARLYDGHTALSRHCVQWNCNVGAPRRFEPPRPDSSPSPLPVGLGSEMVPRRGSNARPRPLPGRALPTELRRRWCPRGWSLLTSALRGRRSTLSYSGMIGSAESIELPTLALQKPASRCASRQNFTTADQPAKNFRCLKPPGLPPHEGTIYGSRAILCPCRTPS